MTETLLTVDEAAQRLRIKPATLRSQLRAGRVRAVRTGKHWRIPESELEPKAAPIAPNFEGVSTPTPDELTALFAPPTSQDIAHQLDALDKLTGAAPMAAPETDLSGDRGEVYGYAERENRQL